MEILADTSTVFGVSFRLEEMEESLRSLWIHATQRIKGYSMKDTELYDQVCRLFYMLDSLPEPDVANYAPILSGLRSAIESLRSEPITRGRSEWPMSTVYRKQLVEVQKKMEHLITLIDLDARKQLAYTDGTLTLKPYPFEAGLGRSGHVLIFLKESEASKQPLRVIIICGQPGIGKTTLLRSVWQHASSKPPFCARAYVHLGEHLRSDDITNLQSEICMRLGEKTAEFPAPSSGQAALYELFKKMKAQNKPVFLAIDNIFAAEHLTMLLPSKMGIEDMPDSSCIVVTCRDESVGDAILRICHLRDDNFSQVLFFEPQPLKYVESKELFAESAGIKLSDPAHQDLLHALTPLCGGLPMALKALGSIFLDEMQRKRKQWRAIERHLVTFDDSLTDSTSRITATLRLRYEFLHPSRQLAFLDIISSFYGWPCDVVEGMVGEEVLKDLRKSSLISKVDSQSQCSRSALRVRGDNMHDVFDDFRSSGYVWANELTLRFGESLINDEMSRLGYAEHVRGHKLRYVQQDFTSIGELPEVTRMRNVILTVSSASSMEQLLALISTLQHARSLQTLIVDQENSISHSTIKYRSLKGWKRHHLRYFSLTGQWGDAWNDYLIKER